MKYEQRSYINLCHDLKGIILKEMNVQDIPGLSIALIDGQQIVWAEG